MQHLALPVTDQERSRGFYEEYLGFGKGPASRHPGGVIILRDARGFALALGPATAPPSAPPFMHFGILVPSPGEVHAIAARLRAGGVPIVEEREEPDDVSVKCRDPDGYVVEIAWEIPPPEHPDDRARREALRGRPA